MDSLTQIVLGAACGEAAAGRKLGSRAILWGAVGGTLPDLDVFAALFTDEISATSFHRGFMHSFMFAALAPWVLAWGMQVFYNSQVFRRRPYKAVAMVLWILFYTGAAVGINFIPVVLGEGLSWYVLIPTLALGLWMVVRLWRDYWRPDLKPVEAPYRTWVLLFFWSIFTHPILDCFTNWGTQIWQPFSNLRVQWTTVSVVDPIYTVPFALLLIAAALAARGSRQRTWLNWAGIAWGCLYLAYTYWHKQQVNTLFEQALQERQLPYTRYMTGPTIFNNIVWSGVAEGPEQYYYGMFGFNDTEKKFTRIVTLPKNHEALAGIPADDRAYQFLRWFSNGYYNVVPYKGDTLQVNDLRFGLQGDTLRGDNYIFPFLLFKNEKGQWDVLQNNRRRENVAEIKQSFSDLWQRVLHGK